MTILPRILFFVMLFALPVAAQDPVRTLFRVSNVTGANTDDNDTPLKFYSGEKVKLTVEARNGNTVVALPAAYSVKWKAWLEATPNTLYIDKAGSVTGGRAVVELTPAEAALTAGTYDYEVRIYDGTTDMGVILSGTENNANGLDVLYAVPSAGVTFTGTSPAYPDTLPELSDVTDGITPTLGKLLVGNGTSWNTLSIGSASQVLTVSGGTAAWAAPSTSGVSDGDKGDITVSGTGTIWTIDNGVVTAAKIGSGAVTAVKLADADFGDWTVASGVATIDTAAVTLAKMANLAQATVIGRASGAGTGAPVALTAAQLATIVSGAGVFLPLAGGTMAGEINFNNNTATNLNKTAFVNGAAVGYLHIDGTDALKYYSTTGGTDRNVIIGNMSGLVDYSLISDAGAAEGEHLVFSGGVWGASTSGAALTGITAGNISGDIPAASFGELAIDWTDRDLHLHTTAQVGWSLYEVDTGTRTFSGDAAKSANASEQAFTFRTGAKVVPRGFVAFKTTGALIIDWIADSTTVADIRGITVLGYNPVTGSKTTIYTDATTRNVTVINVPETVSINRSAFASTVVPTHILVEIDGAIEDSMSMTILNVRLVSE